MSEEAYIQFVTEHAGDDPERLLLSASRWPDIDVRRAARNISARARIRTKVPSWYAHPELDYPSSLSLEQASSETTALYKQAFVPEGARVADLTGGLGVDCWFMSRRAREAHYCERNGDLSAAARHNFAALGDNVISVHEGDGIAWIERQTEHFDLIYIDPARRDAASRRVYDISDCEPDLTAVLDILLAKSSCILAKISPMADIARTLSQLPLTREVHVLAVAGEVKELLLVIKGDAASDTEPLVVACDGRHRLEFHPTEEPAAKVRYAENIGRYLFQPSRAVLKAGAFRLLSERFHLAKLAPSTHLYTSDSPVPDFPGKCFEVESVLDWNKESVRQLKRRYGCLEMTALNFPLTTDNLRSRLGIPDGGAHHLFATTVGDKSKKLIIC